MSLAYKPLVAYLGDWSVDVKKEVKKERKQNRRPPD